MTDTSSGPGEPAPPKPRNGEGDPAPPKPGNGEGEPAPPKPRRGEGWVRAADAAAVSALVLGLFVLLFGGFVLHVGSLLLRVRRPERLLFFAAALSAIRHPPHPSTPL